MYAKKHGGSSMREPEKKTDTVRRLVRERDYRSALRITKDFRLGLSKEDQDAMRLAYECLVRPAFYRQLGRDPVAEVKNGVEVLRRLYGGESSWRGGDSCGEE